MTTHPPILRNSVLASPVTLAIAAGFGMDHAVAALVSSAVVVLNLWVLSVLVPPFTRAVARGDAPTVWAAALVAKFVLLFVTYYLLLHVLPPFGLGLGFVSLMLGTLITGIELARHENARAEGA